MEVHFSAETEEKLRDIALPAQVDARPRTNSRAGCCRVISMNFSESQKCNPSRYDGLKSGRVKPLPGDEVEAYFREGCRASAARFVIR